MMTICSNFVVETTISYFTSVCPSSWFFSTLPCFISKCIRDVLVRAGNFGIEGPGFESSTGATICSKSCVYF